MLRALLFAIDMIITQTRNTINETNECLLIRVICCEQWMKASFSSFSIRYIVEQVGTEWRQLLPLPGSNYIAICALFRSLVGHH